jgi:cell wall-associated NlpC family hydrolase
MLLRCRLLPVSFAHVVVLAVAAFVVAALALPAPAHAAVTRTTRIHHALEIAKQQRGDPYRYGAAGPKRFDCSGLVYFSTHRAGFTNVPRTSSAQSRFMHRISKARMRPGDFMFFTGSGGVYHVGIFVGRSAGRAMVLHAPHPGTRVHVQRVWTSKWFAGTLRG